MLFNLIAALGDTVVALMAGAAGLRLRGALRGRRIARASGVVYIGLGLGAALGHGRVKA